MTTPPSPPLRRWQKILHAAGKLAPLFQRRTELPIENKASRTCTSSPTRRRAAIRGELARTFPATPSSARRAGDEDSLAPPGSG
jgi:hypothetical protein